MARWRALLLCAVLAAAVGARTVAADDAADAAAASDDAAPRPNFGAMRVKELQALLAERGAECKGCSEKADLVQRVAETYDWPIKAQEAPPSGDAADAAEKKPYDRAELEKILANLKIPGGGPGFKVWDKSDLADMRKQFAASGGDGAPAGASGGADAEL